MTARNRQGSTLAIRLLGPFDVRVNGGLLPRLRSRKGLWLLALLTLRHGREVERAWLAGTLWPDSPESQAYASLRQSLTDLRRALGAAAEHLSSPTPHTLLLELAGTEVDVVEFDAAITQGNPPALERAVGLYRGPLLEGCGEEWVLPERAAREQAYLTALEKLAAHALQGAEPATAVGYLRRAVAEDPLRESAYRGLMRALAASGNHAAATESYRELRLRLHRELNAEPDAETRALFEEIRSEARRRAGAGGADSDQRSAVSPAARLSATEGSSYLTADRCPLTASPASSGRLTSASSHNLPAPLTSFVGREQELAQLKERLPATRLLTLTGPGGVGKTRLALQAAVEVVEAYLDGAWLVELGALTDPALVPQSVALALRVRETESQPLVEILKESLRPKSLLLVLDNCEHLVGACAELAEALLRGCPGLRILATSREALGVGGETPWTVAPLSLPNSGVQEENGVAAASRAIGTPEHLNTRTPEHLTQFEAIRLFVERASTAAPAFTLTRRNAAAVAQVCQRLDGIPLAIELAAARVKVLTIEQIATRLDEVFRLLTGGSRTALPRHQTLRAAMDWSYDLLTEKERTLLRRLSVFAGGFTLEAAEAVCSDFGFRISDFGFKGDDETPADDASCPQIRNPISDIRNEEVLDLLTRLIEKSLVMIQEGTGAAEAAQRGGGGAGRDEGSFSADFRRYRLLETVRQYSRDRLLEAGEATSVRNRHRDQFLAFAERGAPELSRPEVGDWLDRLEREHDNLRSALTWCRSEPGGAERGLRLAAALGRFWFMRGHFREGRHWLEEMLTAQDGGDGQPGTREAGGGEAATEASEGLARGVSFQAHVRHRMGALLGAATIALFQGDCEASDRWSAEYLEFARAAGQKRQIAFALFNLAITAAYAGDYERAEPHAREALTLARAIGDEWLIARPVVPMGLVALHRRDFAAARALFEEGISLSRKVGDSWSVAQIIPHLGEALQEQNEFEATRALYQEGLALCRQIDDRRLVTWYLVGLARMASAQGRAAGAARLLGAAEALLELLGSSLPEFMSASLESSQSVARTALDEETFAAAWAEGRAMALEQALTAALEFSDLRLDA